MSEELLYADVMNWLLVTGASVQVVYRGRTKNVGGTIHRDGARVVVSRESSLRERESFREREVVERY